MTTCCFTGHRQIPARELLPLRAALTDCLRPLIEAGVRTFRAGGALGFDRLAAETVIALRPDYADRFHLALELILPCHGQSDQWPPEERLAYRRILAAADRSFVLQDDYSTGCMHRRNLALLDGCDVCVCYRSHLNGGTAYTVAQAHRRSIPVINLAAVGGDAEQIELFTEN